MYSAQSQAGKQSGSQRHEDVMKELDEIKRYVAGIYQNVDTEINEVRDITKRLERQVNENDRQIDRIENFERTLRNIEASLKNLERKIR